MGFTTLQEKQTQVFTYYDRQGFCPNTAECGKRGMTQVCDKATGATLAIRCDACGYWRRF